MQNLADQYNLDLTISLDHLPDGYEYNLILTDKYKRLLSMGRRTDTGGKSITIPSWCLKDANYTLTVQRLEAGAVIAEEQYVLSFRENELHMEYLQGLQAAGFQLAVRKKLWEKQNWFSDRDLERKVSAWERHRTEEKYLEQMETISFGQTEYFA